MVSSMATQQIEETFVPRRDVRTLARREKRCQRRKKIARSGHGLNGNFICSSHAIAPHAFSERRRAVNARRPQRNTAGAEGVLQRGRGCFFSFPTDLA